jgi:hypothetical protein
LGNLIYSKDYQFLVASSHEFKSTPASVGI